MQKNVINTSQVKKLLPPGALKEIAIRSKTSYSTVERVFNRGGKNTKVLKALKEYIEEIQQISTDINALVADTQISC